MAKNGVDGVYDKDPNEFDDAKFYKTISYKEMLDKELKVIDLSCITLAQENKIKIRVFDVSKKNVIIDIVNGQNIGTYIGECENE